MRYDRGGNGRCGTRMRGYIKGARRVQKEPNLWGGGRCLHTISTKGLHLPGFVIVL